MGRYIAFREKGKDKTLISFRAGSYPNSFGRFLEQNLSLNYDGPTTYDLDEFISETMLVAEKDVQEAHSDILLDLLKRDFQNHEMVEKFRDYQELSEIVGMIRTIAELFETHGEELEVHYG